MLLRNADLAATKGLPLCQDTGTVWVLIEAGAKVQTDLRGLQESLDEVVAEGFAQHHLRASTLRDALNDRSNPENNTPAFVEYVQLPAQGDPSDYELRVHAMLKGAGSDNASELAMLSPGSSEEDIINFVVDHVRAKGVNACPPLIIGLGVGGGFDKAASLSKRALLRPLGGPEQKESQEKGHEPAKDRAALEQKILQRVNELGIGPAGLGGQTTALAVHIESAPSHIASLPIAVNLCCHSLRSRSSVLYTK
jgi:fumarate hydratase class I/fumarate hydratase subunit alpha